MEISPFYNKQIECFNCKNKFKTKKIRSRFVRVESHDTDFKPIYMEPSVNPLFYNVVVCPQCGFSFTEDFSPYFAPGTKEAISKQITAKWNSRSFGEERNVNEAIETYKLAYLSSMLKKEKAITIAGLNLRIGWLYRDMEELEEEKRFLTIARNYYIDSYSKGDYTGTQMPEVRVLYIIAELSRKIGDDSEAIRNFSRVIEMQGTSSEQKVIEMAKERWQEMRTKIKRA